MLGYLKKSVVARPKTSEGYLVFDQSDPGEFVEIAQSDFAAAVVVVVAVAAVDVIDLVEAEVAHLVVAVVGCLKQHYFVPIQSGDYSLKSC